MSYLLKRKKLFFYVNVVESFGLEEGEVGFSWRVRKWEELVKWKVEKMDGECIKNCDVVVNGLESLEGEKLVV